MRLFNNLSIRSKILMLACIGCAGLLFNLAFYAWTSLANEGRLNAVREQHFPVLEHTDRALATLEDLDASLREAIGDIEVLDDAQEFVWIIDEQLDSIVNANPSQEREAERLRLGVEEYVSDASLFAERVDAGQVSDFATEAQAMTGKLIATVNLFTEYRKEKFAVFVGGIEDAEAAGRRALWMSVVVSVTIFIALIFASAVISNLMNSSFDTVRLLAGMSRGDLTVRIEGDYKGMFGTLKDDANATVAKFAEVVRNIQATATSVKTGADEMSEGNANLSQRTEEQAASLEETASSLEEMTSTVKQNADNAGEANQLALAAREQAEKGGVVVSQAVTAMNEINASSKKISDIIGVIDEIAFQTNLLALNASVEAARAGDQGRGFAVVADEVRNLAGRSATAAKEIKDLIVDSASKVEDGSRLVNESGEMLEEIVNGVKKVTNIVGEITAASQEQSAGIDQVNRAVIQLEEMTQQNAALVEEAAAASQSMGEQAGGLDQLISFFTVNGNAAGKGMDISGHSGSGERRSADRPWTELNQSDDVAQTDMPAPPKRAAANSGDAEWEEF